jgi:hypothetical protein
MLMVDPYDIDNASTAVGMAADLGIDDESDNTVYNDKLENHFLTGKDLLLTTNQKGLYAITGKSIKDTSVNSLYIEHIKDVVPVTNGKPIYVPWIWGGTVSFYTFNKPYLIFNTDGKMLNPAAINIDGYMLLQSRMATALPFDYKPMQ